MTDLNYQPDDFVLEAARTQTLQAVEEWQVEALGKSPENYMVRDLLLSSLIRDHRPVLFHQMIKDSPAWIAPLVSSCAPEMQQQAAQLVALHYFHRRQLELLSHPEFQRYEGQGDDRLLTRLKNCTPFGALMNNAYVQEERYPICRLPWLCPWCYARQARHYYRFLKKGPLHKPPNNKFLVLCTLTVRYEDTVELFNELPDAANADTEPGSGLTKAEFIGYRNLIFQRLHKIRKKLKLEGGILTPQVSPGIPYIPNRGYDKTEKGYQYDFALFGEITFKSEKEYGNFMSKLDGSVDELIKIPITGYLEDRDVIFPLSWYIHPAGAKLRDPLRLFLMGTSANYDADNLYFKMTDFAKHTGQPNGFRGALFSPPNFMMTRNQWWDYAEATRGTPTYSPFGTWRAAKAQERKGKAKTLLPFTERQRELNRKKGLREHKKKKMQASVDKFTKLVAVARPLYQQVVGKKSSGRGRPDIRRRLKDLLGKNGVEVSAYDMKGVESLRCACYAAFLAFLAPRSPDPLP